MGTVSRHTSLLTLDTNSFLHITGFLSSPRDLASLQQCCKLLYGLLQASSSWAHVLELQHGFKIQAITTSDAAQAGAASGVAAAAPLPHCKGLVRLLARSAPELYPVRFGALLTDGGVDEDSPQYWADQMFIPNVWAPYCSSRFDDVNVLAVLKTGPTATSELRYRSLLLGWLRYVMAGIIHLAEAHPPGLPPGEMSVRDFAPGRLAHADKVLADMPIPALEAHFLEVASQLNAGHPLGPLLLAGTPGPRDEARQAALALAASIRQRSWYDRAYKLSHMEPRLPQRRRRPAAPDGAGSAAAGQPAVGGGGAPPGLGADLGLSYVLDENAAREYLASEHAGSSVALVQGVSVSREGVLSCPVLCGALMAGMLPPGWPPRTAPPARGTVLGDAGEAGAGGAAGEGGAGGSGSGTAAGGLPAGLAPYADVLAASLGQPSVAALDGMTDAASVLSACASGALPPWVRHVAYPHGEWIEFLPPHLRRYGPVGAVMADAEGGDADKAQAGPCPPAGVLPVHPVLWFRFTEHAEYTRRRPCLRGRAALSDLSRHLDDVAGLLGGDPLCRRRGERQRGAPSQGLQQVLQELRSLAGIDGGASDSLPCGGSGDGLGGGGGCANKSSGEDGEGGEGEGEHGEAGDDERREEKRKLETKWGSSVVRRITCVGRSARVAVANALLSLQAARAMGPRLAALAGAEVPQVVAAALGHCQRLAAALGAVSDAVQGLRSAGECAAALGRLGDGEAAVLWGAGVEERRELAAALRRGSAAAVRPPHHLAVLREVRNEQLLARLPLELPPRQLPTAAARPAPAATEGGAAASAAAAGGTQDARAPLMPPPAAAAAGFVRPLPGPHATLEEPPPEGWAAERLFDPRLQSDVDRGRAGLGSSAQGDRVHRAVHLYAPLLLPRAANTVVFKAVRPENLSSLVGWDNAGRPNVDVQCVGLQGRVLRLPAGVQAVAV